MGNIMNLTKEKARRNRYIVECKEEWERIKGQFDARRNRYIVECKAVIFNIRVVRRAV